jgi:hypothetical protein
MNVTAHRTIVSFESTDPADPSAPDPVQPDPVDPDPVDPGTDAPGQPGPRPPPKLLSAEALTALVSQLAVGSACNRPEETPGPMDPYMRRALERTAMGAGMSTALWRDIALRHPEVWDVIGGDPQAQISLNPQPLPPRPAFVAGVVLEFTERMTLVLEIADLIPLPGAEQGIVIVGGHVARFVDALCINGLHIRWPLPWSAPSWFPDTLSGADLIVMGTQFQQSAAIAMDRDLGRTFADAAHALLEAGAARLQ